MPARATVTVDLGKVRANARTVVDALPGISVVGVTKVTCGSPQVARTMLAGGAKALGESRLENAERLRDAGLTAPIWLLRAPVPELAGEVVQLTDVSLESELETVVALENAAAAAGRRHAVVAMVDLGDLREGMLPADLPAFLDRVDRMSHIDIAGIGVNLTCYGAIMPDEDNLGRLAELAERSERRLGRPLLVSGGNSGSIGMVTSGRMPAAVDSLRIGETILLGVDTLTREPTLGLHLDAFIVEAPVVECLVKPSLPQGTVAQDAFGNRPLFTDRGARRRAICALGRQDAPPDGLVPVDPRVEVLGASSDHLILDVEALDRPPALGDCITFVPTYAATLQLFTSPYVTKVFTPPA
ncbi:MAG: alanine/ornithine racemase family PLP-dependent enzyme [Actinobacteria bacterium]|nr:alanine/ornithine racemase family PLP-dependent enzyme [Acidobacteriota bacterium]NLE21732.1 alanine/ornithine racemase family PLP-dependent enzyme [Actinomycetota bacterium]